MAFLRQEFVDELVPERSLREEFMSVFSQETGLLTRLRELEKELEASTNDPMKLESVMQVSHAVSSSTWATAN